MYYIQRYHEKDKVNQKEANNNPTIGRFLDGDYMGSAEFDFGSVSRSWANMLENLPKIHRLDLTFKGSLVTKEVPMFVIAEESQLDSIKDELNKHLDGKRVGKLTKEYTGLWETFKHHYIEKQERTWGLVDLWLDVSPFVRTGRADVRSAVFGLDPKLVIRVYMELLRAKLMKDKAPEVSIGDLVYVQHDKEIVEAKVEDIGEYFTYTLSYFQNRMAVSVFDVLAKKDVQDDSFVKMIRDLDTSTPTL